MSPTNRLASAGLLVNGHLQDRSWLEISLAFGWTNRVGRRNVGGRCERLRGVEDMCNGNVQTKTRSSSDGGEMLITSNNRRRREGRQSGGVIMLMSMVGFATVLLLASDGAGCDMRP